MKNSPDGQSNKWLIIFLIYADFTTNEQMSMVDRMKIMVNSMLGDIITTPINNDQTRMFVILNTIKYKFSNHKTEIDDNVVLYTIECKKNGIGNHIKFCKPLDKNTYFNKSDQLASALKATEVQPDEHVFLITWDHGSVFGIFRKELPKLNRTSVKLEIYQDLYQYPFIKLFWNKIKKEDKNWFSKVQPGKKAYTSIQVGNSIVKVKNSPENKRRLRYYLKKESQFVYNEKASRIRFVDSGDVTENANVTMQRSLFRRKKTPVLSDGLLHNELEVEPRAAEILTNSELNDCLKKWLGEGRQVAVLLMSNCWMMNLHTMYALKESVKCLVAPQGSIDLPGYNLKDILFEINAHAGKLFEPAELAKTCVKTIENDYSRAKAVMLDPSEPGVIELFKVFAVDLSATTNGNNILQTHINLLTEIINLLVKQLQMPSAKKTEMKYFLKYVRSVCFDFTGGFVMMIDIVNWIRTINSANYQFDISLKKLPPLFKNPIATFEDSLLKSSIILDQSTGSNIYTPNDFYTSNDKTGDFTTIKLPPTGYSLFFPIENCRKKMNRYDYANVKANVLSDQLLKDLSNWREFLKFIDPRIDKIFR